MFQQLILPKRSDDEELTETSRALATIVGILLSASLLILVGLFALPEYSNRWWGLFLGIYALCIPTFVLNRLGYTRFASVFLIVGWWTFLTTAAITAGGIESFAPLFYVTVVFIAGLLSGSRAAIVSALFCILTALGMVIIETTGHMPSSPVPHTPLTRWIAVTVLIVIVMGLQYLSLGRVQHALRRSRRELKERTRTENELRRVSERLQLATRAASIGIWDWDVRNDELVWDDAMYRLYGVRKEDFSGAFDAWAKSLAPEDFDRANDEVQTALRGEQEFAGEFRIVWPDGSVHYTGAASQTFQDEAGRPVRMVGVNYDISERKLAEEALKAAKERSETLINTIEGIVWEADATTFEFTFVSKQAEQFLGYQCEQWLKQPTFWKDHIHPDDRDRTVSYYVSCTEQMLDHDFEYRMIAADGQEVWLRDIVTVMVENNAPKTLRGIMVDITAQKQAEERVALLQAITADIAAASDLSSALEVVLRRVCEKTGWALGQAWLPNEEGTALNCCPAWFATSANLEAFRNSTKNFAFTAGVGLPGRVWARRQPVWIPDVTEDTNFPRGEFARSCGLKAGLGVPIVSGDHVIAVLEFFLHETRDEDERLVKVISAVAAQIDLMVERKRAEDALRESEASFRVLTETAASAILIYQDDKYRYANPAAEAITGYQMEEILSMTLLDTVHPEFHELIRGRARARQRGEDVAPRYEVKIIAKSGEERWLDAAASNMEFKGRPAVLVTAFDVTERKRAEDALQRNEELFRAIVEDQTEMIVRWKPDGTRTFVNQAYCRVFGGCPEDFIGTIVYPRVAEKYREGIQVKVSSLTPEDPLVTEIHECTLENGETRLQEWTDRGVFDAKGNLVELQSTGRDITERKRAEEALRESERRLSDTLTNIEMIAMMADMNGDITFCNDYLLRLTDWKREEAIGRNWYEMFLPEGEKVKVSKILHEVEPNGEVKIHLENEIKTRTGERRLVKWTNTTLRGLDGKVIGIAALGDDITERKAAEEQLKASSDQLRVLFERVGRAKEEEGIRIARELHDELGSALTSLKWSLFGLDKVYSANQNADGHASARLKIEEMVGLVDSTINAVRRISSELRPGILDDLGVVAAIEWQAQQFQSHSGILCEFESLADDVTLDREQGTVVFRIFQEAMTNVLRHSRATKVNVIIEEEDGELLLEVSDNGRGISEFEKRGALSLGLLGMRERAHSIGGTIEIIGAAGRGTRLIVRLPSRIEAHSVDAV